MGIHNSSTLEVASAIAFVLAGCALAESGAKPDWIEATVAKDKQLGECPELVLNDGSRLAVHYLEPGLLPGTKVRVHGRMVGSATCQTSVLKIEALEKL